jgi:hypothetical protein
VSAACSTKRVTGAIYVDTRQDVLQTPGRMVEPRAPGRSRPFPGRRGRRPEGAKGRQLPSSTTKDNPKARGPDGTLAHSPFHPQYQPFLRIFVNFRAK